MKKTKGDEKMKKINNTILDMIRKIEYDPHVSPMMKYICVVLKNLFVFNLFVLFVELLFNIPSNVKINKSIEIVSRL